MSITYPTSVFRERAEALVSATCLRTVFATDTVNEVLGILVLIQEQACAEGAILGVNELAERMIPVFDEVKH